MKRSATELHDVLRAMLRESLRLDAEGGARTRLVHAQGCADGFMRALIEAGVSDHLTLLAIVREVRAECRGPATQESDANYAAA